MSEWQDISTAPRKGAKLSPEFGPSILLTNKSNSIAIGYWDDKGLNPSGRSGWICIQAHRPLYSQNWTHWMPLPAPPSKEPSNPKVTV